MAEWPRRPWFGFTSTPCSIGWSRITACWRSGASPCGIIHRCSPVFTSIAVIRPTGPFQMRSPSIVAWSAVFSVTTPVARENSECVTPVCSGPSNSDSMPGATITGVHPLVEVTKMTPPTGSAAGGPVMFAPPPPPGQMSAAPSPSGLPTCVGGLKSGTKRSFSRAYSSAISRSSGV